MNETFEKVVEILAGHVDAEAQDITMESTFKDLGLDSLDTVELVMEIEDEFGVNIEVDESIKSVSDIVALIDAE